MKVKSFNSSDTLEREQLADSQEMMLGLLRAWVVLRYGKLSTAGRMRLSQTHRDPGCVDKTPVEMAQCCLRLLLRLEAYKAELAELAVFGELKATVSQCAEGGKQLPESLLLHLGEKGHDEEPGIPGAKGQRSWTPRGPGGHRRAT